LYWPYFVFFFQAEDGIRDPLVTGVQTCALPISSAFLPLRPQSVGERPKVTLGLQQAVDPLGIRAPHGGMHGLAAGKLIEPPFNEIGRASCRERVEIAGGAVRSNAQTHEDVRSR